MTQNYILGLLEQSIYTILVASAPMLGLGLLVGLLVSIFQATTQIQEQTLAFIPKIIAVLLALVIFGPMILSHLLDFTENIFTQIGTLK